MVDAPNANSKDSNNVLERGEWLVVFIAKLTTATSLKQLTIDKLSFLTRII